MKESDIRDPKVHARYLELVRQDAERIFRDHTKFENIACPACDGREVDVQFEKGGFTYVQCAECDTLFVSPRPDYRGLLEFYTLSESTSYWVNEFFAPMAEARREKIFKPRAEYVARSYPDHQKLRIGDIGAGFGLFLAELRKLWKDAELVAIEPSQEMAKIIREQGFAVIEQMFEDIDTESHKFDFITAFELAEHLHNPRLFFRKAFNALNSGGLLYFTTLSGHGFDIQTFWKDSRAVMPPHHLNFFNPFSARILMEAVGFEIVEISTPGELDWDIVEGALKTGGPDPGRFLRVVSKYGTEKSKRDLQEWIKCNNFSSHMRVVARRP